MIGLKKGMSYLLCAAMVLTMGPVSSFAGEVAQESETVTFIDMPDGWARAGLEHGVANGLLKGYKTAAGFEIRPAGKITRAELVTAVNRAFGAIETASLDGVTDVDPDAWYATEIAEAVAMRTMTKAEKMRPNDKVTRQEAFTILARAYEIGGGTRADLAGFKDADSVAEYAVDSLGALVKAGYVSGSEGKLNPTGDMTRAEFAKIMDNLTAVYVHDGGEYSDDVTGNVIVNTGGACLKDMNIDGDLIVAEGVGEGDADLVNLNVTGDIIVKAGGDHSIRFDGVNARYLIIDKELGNTPVRTALSGKMSVKEVFVKSDAIIDTANADKSSDLGTVLISGEAVKNLKLNGWFNTVENLAADLKLTATGTIEKLTAEVKTEVAGGAEIKDVLNRSGSDIKVNDKVVQSESKPEGTTEGGNKTDAVNNGGSGSRGGGSHSGGGGGSKVPDTPQLTDAQKAASDKSKIEASAIKIFVPYNTEDESVKTALTKEVNGLSGLYNKNWEIDTFEKFDKTLYNTEENVDVSFKLGETVTEIFKAVVYVEPMTVADKRAADKSRLESLTTAPAVSVGYYGSEGDVKKAIEDLVNDDTEYFCDDWSVTYIDGFVSETKGTKTVAVKLTSGDVTTDEIQVSVTTLPMTNDEMRAADKAFLEFENQGKTVKVGNLATEDEVKEAVTDACTDSYSLNMRDWSLVYFTGFTPRQAGNQSICVKFQSEDVITDEIVINLNVAELTLKEKLMLQKKTLEDSADSFAVTVLDTDNEFDVRMAVGEKVSAVCSGWEIESFTGFKKGETGEQSVTVVLESDEIIVGDSGYETVKTDSIAVKVTVKKMTDEEKLALDEAALETGLKDAEFTLKETEKEEVLVDAIEDKANNLAKWFSWDVDSISGFTEGKVGTQSIKVVLSCDVMGTDIVRTEEISVNVTVKALTIEDKVAEDRDKIRSMFYIGARAHVPYGADEATAKAAIAGSVNALGDLHYKDWTVTTLTGYDPTDIQTWHTVSLELTSAAAGTSISFEDVTAVIVNDKTPAVKLAEDRAKLEAAGDALAVAVGVKDNMDTVKGYVAEKANAVSGLNYSDWSVSGITGLTPGTPGTYNTKVTLTNSKQDDSVDPAVTKAETTGEIAVVIKVNDLSDAEKIAHDKEILQSGSLNSKLGIKLTSINDTGDQVAAAIAEKANALEELLYHNWTVEMLDPAKYGDAYHQGEGDQTIDIIIKAGNESIKLEYISITAPEPTEAEKLAIDKALLEAGLRISQDAIFEDEINETIILNTIQDYINYEVLSWYTDGQWEATITSGKENIRRMEAGWDYQSYHVKVVFEYKDKNVKTSEVDVEIYCNGG